MSFDGMIQDLNFAVWGWKNEKPVAGTGRLSVGTAVRVECRKLFISLKTASG